MVILHFCMPTHPRPNNEFPFSGDQLYDHLILAVLYGIYKKRKGSICIKTAVTTTTGASGHGGGINHIIGVLLLFA